MVAINSGDESDHDLISTEMLEDICDRSQTHPKCANVITLPVCSFVDVAYGVYVTARRIAIVSEQGRDLYANALEKLSSNTTSYEDIIVLVLGTYTRYPF